MIETSNRVKYFKTREEAKEEASKMLGWNTISVRKVPSEEYYYVVLNNCQTLRENGFVEMF